MQSVKQTVSFGWDLITPSFEIKAYIIPRVSRRAAGRLLSQLFKSLKSRFITITSPATNWKSTHPILICEASVARKSGLVLSTTCDSNSKAARSNNAFHDLWCTSSQRKMPLIPIRCNGAETSFIAKRYRRWYASTDKREFISAQERGTRKFLIASSLAGGMAVDPQVLSNQWPKNLNEVTKGENLFGPIRNPALSVAQSRYSISLPWSSTCPGLVESEKRQRSSI